MTHQYFNQVPAVLAYSPEPMADHTSSGTAYLPAGQIAGWGRGIALLARTLTS